MFKLDIVNVYDTAVNYKQVRSISLANKDVLDVNIKLDLNSPHQMQLLVNPNMPFWEEFANNPLYGIRYRTDTLDIVYIKKNPTILMYGETEINLFSTSYKLKTVQRDLRDLLYKGDLATFLGKFPSEFVFTPISSSTNIIIDTGVLDNLELLSGAVGYPEQFGWRENGLVDVGGGVLKTEILYGHFGDDITSYYNTSSDDRAKPLRTYTFTSSPNDDLDVAPIKSLERRQTGEVYTHIYPVGDTGGGANQSTSIRLTNPLASYIDPQYPLVPLYNAERGQNDYYVLNPNASWPVPRVLDYPYTYSVNKFDSSGNAELTVAQREELLYRAAVSYIQALQVESYFEVDVELKKAVLPGNHIDIRYRSTNQDGVIIHDVNEVQTLKPYEYSLNVLQN